MTLPMEAVSRNDPRIAALRDSAGGERERRIETLIVHVARPVAERVLSRFLKSGALAGRQDAEDVLSTVSLALITKLRAAAESPEQAVRDFDEYVATLTYNAVNDYFRRRWPQRTRLKNRLRYALTHDARFALWMAQEGLLCGLAPWNGRAPREMPTLGDTVERRMRDRDRAGAALAALFEVAGAPLAFDDVVALFAKLWQIVDSPLAEIRDDAAYAAPQANVEWRELLTALWRELTQLRPMQRKALLLNLRDAETAHALSLFVFTGIATIDEIAAALELAPAELSAIWNDLPFDDLRIASMLRVTRQQVINLRRSARERLGRRLPYKKS